MQLLLVIYTGFSLLEWEGCCEINWKDDLMHQIIRALCSLFVVTHKICKLLTTWCLLLWFLTMTLEHFKNIWCIFFISFIFLLISDCSKNCNLCLYEMFCRITKSEEFCLLCLQGLVGWLTGWEILLAVPLNQDLYVDHACSEITGIGAHCPMTLQELWAPE
jgi:hypothetical protein